MGETWAAALMHCYRIQMDLCVDRKVIKQNLPHSCWFPAASISCTISLLFDACLLSSISFVSITYIEGSYSVRRPYHRYHQYHLIFSLSQLSSDVHGMIVKITFCCLNINSFNTSRTYLQQLPTVYQASFWRPWFRRPMERQFSMDLP